MGWGWGRIERMKESHRKNGNWISQITWHLMMEFCSNDSGNANPSACRVPHSSPPTPHYPQPPDRGINKPQHTLSPSSVDFSLLFESPSSTLLSSCSGLFRLPTSSVTEEISDIFSSTLHVLSQSAILFTFWSSVREFRDCYLEIFRSGEESNLDMQWCR